MNDMFARIVAVALVVFTAAKSTAAAAAERCTSDHPFAGRVAAVEVLNVRDVSDDPVSLVTGDALCLGDRIEADRRSVIVLESGVRIGVGPGTQFILEETRGRTLLRLVSGVATFFSYRPHAITVYTRAANAAVEGTEFTVQVWDDRTWAGVLEGRVRFENAIGAVDLGPDEAAVAIEGRAPEIELGLHPRDAVRWALYYPPLGPAQLPPDAPASLRETARLSAAGEWTEALERLQSAPPPAREAPEFYTLKAELLLGQGRAEEAVSAVKQALWRRPGDPDALALSSILALARDDKGEALADARRAVELVPGNARARLALSYAAQANFDIPLARASLEAAVAAEPGNALAWARLGETQLMQGDIRGAAHSAARAVALDPNSSRAQSVLGFVALAQIETDRATAAFSRAIELDAFAPLARFGLGLATIRAGDLEKGRREIEIAVVLDPTNALLRSYLGKAFFDERTTNPLTYFEELIANFPNQENKLAARQFAIAKQLDPNDPTPYLYDAIRLQSENRPIEALRDLEKSIQLNDNRAVYRSRELLDADRAARGTSLARIYNDLGFAQLGINEATKSLGYDPSSAAAHRFLSDAYATRPRHEIARASELLQAQLLQDININPVQPSLVEADRNMITSGGPARAGFSEFTPLFERNTVQLNVSGLVGSHGTYADEAVVSGIYNKLSLSAGQFFSTTDGFRRNADSETRSYNLFAQAAVNPNFNLQVEARQHSNEQGDLWSNFSMEDYSASRRRRFDQTTGRLGLRFSPAPHSQFITSLIYADRDASRKEHFGQSEFRFDTAKQEGVQGEAQYLFSNPLVSIISGLSVYSFDTHQFFKRFQDHVVKQEILDRNSTQRQYSYYLYNYVPVGKHARFTIGVSYDYFDHQKRNIEELNPKLGFEWNILQDLLLRVAAFQTVRPALAASQTIQPTQVAGFNQFYDDRNATRSRLYGLGVDWRIAEGLYTGVEISRRDLDTPPFGNTEAPFQVADQREDNYSRIPVHDIE